MAVEQPQAQQPAPAGPARSEVRFPAYDLAAAINVPKIIHTRGGGQATPDQLASYLGYKGTNNGAYLARVGAARAFGLIAKSGNVFSPSPLAQQIISPVYPQDAKRALVEAFFNVELFKKVYEDFKGRELPPEAGLKNNLMNKHGVVATRVELAYRTLLDSAETAGLFETKGGARTHLIISQQASAQGNTMASPASAPATESNIDADASSDDTAFAQPQQTRRPSAAQSISDVKAQYLSTLIKLFEAKSEKGELDEKLMERIERLLEGQ